MGLLGTTTAESYYTQSQSFTGNGSNKAFVLTKTNLDAITSINTVVANVSSTLATSIGNSNTNIASYPSYGTIIEHEKILNTERIAFPQIAGHINVFPHC